MMMVWKRRYVVVVGGAAVAVAETETFYIGVKFFSKVKILLF